MERPGDDAIVSKLEGVLALVEAGLGGLVTTLESESPSDSRLALVTEGYQEACGQLDALLEGLAVLPVELRPRVMKIAKLQAIARHLVATDLDQTAHGLAKVRSARLAIGRHPQGDQAVFGSTGVDCNISG